MSKIFLSFIENSLEKFREQNRLRILPLIKKNGKYLELDGKAFLNLASNDYLGLSSSGLYAEFLRQNDFSDIFPAGSGGSRLLSGNNRFYDELENSLQKEYGRPALVFASGYHANTGIIPALFNEHDVIFSDHENHASIVDGIRLCGAKTFRFRHNDVNHLSLLLKKERGRYHKALIITESIFSMHGDCAPLAGYTELKNRYDAVLYVDEAHAVGVSGNRGLGLGYKDADIMLGTFGKAFSSVGAWVISSSRVREYLINACRSFIFSTALPPAVLAWNNFIFRKNSGFEDKRLHLAELHRFLRGKFSALGFKSPGSTHIVPLICGSNEQAVFSSDLIRARGIFSPPVRPPAVPQGSARLRFSLRADLEQKDVEIIPEVLSRAAHSV